MDQLPPLPKSLAVSSPSQIEETVKMEAEKSEPVVSLEPLNVGNQKLDEKLQTLRREMIGLRQLDLSLLAQLNTLQQNIQEYKRVLSESLDLDWNDINVYDQRHNELNDLDWKSRVDGGDAQDSQDSDEDNTAETR